MQNIKICDNIDINDQGHLTFAGYDTVDLANKYSTPLYLMDEDKIREKVRIYKNAMAKYLPEGSMPEFASKAFSCRAVYRIMAEEGIDVDVVSSGELYTAFSAGFPMENVFFHGNNKTDSDITFAMEKGVGFFVVDGAEELYAIQTEAENKGITQKILLRITPGIDPHTHKKISTGSEESKFGIPLRCGAALDMTKAALSMKNIHLCGFHCHVGSQIFECEPFINAAEIMFKFFADVKAALGYTPEIFNIGGGLGVRYTCADPVIDYDEKIKEIADKIYSEAQNYGINPPKIMMEPGRSLVADAGMTLYTIGSVKEIKGFKNYVSIDGGMTDNPRYTLYESPYTVVVANKADKEKNFAATIAGRCCESGDLIQENAEITEPERGDILAVLTTGAYNYSMASNYNRVPRPPVVMLGKDKEYVAVKRESFEDLCALDV